MPVLNITLACIMFGLGLDLSTRDFRQVAEKPKAALVGLFGQLILLPALAFLLIRLLELDLYMAVGLVLIASCPGGTHSNLFADLARGDTALSISLTAVSSVLILVTLPLWMGLAISMYGGGEVALPVGKTTAQALGIIAIPLAAGMGFRAWKPNAALTLQPFILGIAILLLVIIVLGSVAINQDRVLELAAQAGPAVVMLQLGSMTLGAGLAALAGLEREQGISVVLEVGVQNATLAVGLGMGVLGEVAYATPAIVYSLLVYVTAALVIGACRAWIPSQAPG